MNVALKPEFKKFIEKQIKAGRYGSVEDVLAAGITRLMQDNHDFGLSPGELQMMVDEGEADITEGNTVTLSQTRKHFRDRSGIRQRRSHAAK